MSRDNSPKLLVFLGNTGRRYELTRHNVAFRLAPVVVQESPDGWQRKFKAVWTRASIEGAAVVALMPQIMMNLSGESVQAATRFFRFAAAEVAVVHDDVELPFGGVGVRFGGGLAGHNGLRSVSHCLGTNDYWRVRIGVGRPARGELHAHVLGRFTPQEEAELDSILAQAADLIGQGYREGFQSVQKGSRT